LIFPWLPGPVPLFPNYKYLPNSPPHVSNNSAFCNISQEPIYMLDIIK
jgi:hypothetical protein